MGEVEKKAFFDGCFLQYKSLRDEITATTDQFYKILQYGSTAILSFVGIAFSFWQKDNYLVLVAFGVLIPTLSFIFVELLLGQLARIKRAALYTRAAEN